METLPIKLTVITPEKVALDVMCDFVSFYTLDNAEGLYGGSMGVEKGHIKTVAALAEGDLKAFAEGKEIASYKIESAIASIDNDVITVITK